MQYKGKELRYSFRSFMIYETITGKAFQPESLLDVLTFFYSCVIASDKNSTLTFETFLDEIDANPTVVTEFSNWLTAQVTVNDQVVSQDAINAKNDQLESMEQNMKDNLAQGVLQ